MKPLKILAITIVLLIALSTGCMAAIRTVYPTDEPILIKTKLDHITFINFKTTIVTAAVGNKDLFSVLHDNMSNRVKITPLMYGAYSNLIVFTADGEKYVFWLEEVGEEDKSDGIVNMASSPEVNIADIISLINKRKIAIDPAIKELIKFYEITEPTLAKYENIVFHLKRAATISNINKTVYWLRVENTSDKLFTLPNTVPDEDNGNDSKNKSKNNSKKNKNEDVYCIPLNTICVKDRPTAWVAVEANKERLIAGEYTDLYLVVDGNYIDPSLKITFVCNNKSAEVVISNIPYSKQEFRVFVVENNNYTSVSIEDYWR